MEARGLGTLLKAVLRTVLELLIWLPIWLIIESGLENRWPWLLIGGALFALGLGLQRLPVVWRRGMVALAIVATLVIGMILNKHEWQGILLLAVMIFRSQFNRFNAANYAIGFAACCVSLATVYFLEMNVAYRTLFIIGAFAWIIAWFPAWNRSLLDNAGLSSGIATRAVRGANRKYLLLFLLIGVVAVAATVQHGSKLLHPKPIQLNVDFGLGEVKPNGLMPDAPRTEQEMPEAQDSTLKNILNILFYIVSVFAFIGLFWFIRLLWRDRTWTWKGMLEAIRRWYMRDKTGEDLPYIEEQRSLKKAETRKVGRWRDLFQTNRRVDWDKLDNGEKIRKLYEEAVLAAVEEGYTFRAADTPAETLADLERWYQEQANQRGSGKRSTGAERGWLVRIRPTLVRLYEKAKYSPHAVSEQEVESVSKEQKKQ